MKRTAIALAVLALAGATPALATNPPPRRAYPAAPSLRTLLLKCAAGNQRACVKLDKRLK
jgi:hypothetical protein